MEHYWGIFLGVTGLALVVVGFHFIGGTMNADAPTNRALGAKGISVSGKLVARSTSYPLITTVQYTVPAHNGLPALPCKQDILEDPVVTGTALGWDLAFRVDPENPNFIIREGSAKPATWFKTIGSVLAMICGAIFMFLGLAVYVSR